MTFDCPAPDVVSVNRMINGKALAVMGALMGIFAGVAVGVGTCVIADLPIRQAFALAAGAAIIASAYPTLISLGITMAGPSAEEIEEHPERWPDDRPGPWVH